MNAEIRQVQLASLESSMANMFIPSPSTTEYYADFKELYEYIYIYSSPEIVQAEHGAGIIWQSEENEKVSTAWGSNILWALRRQQHRYVVSVHSDILETARLDKRP